jgi:hypothetical protein
MVVSKICGIAREGGVGLAHDEGRARHALDAAGDHQIGVAGADGARGGADGVHARAAQSVDRGAGDFERQAGEQGRHARDVAVVLAGLVGAAVEDVVERAPVEVGMAQHQRPDGQGGEIVGSDRGERAAVAADGGAYGVADEGFVQFILLAS